MIAVDTSALMAIVLREPERAGLLAALNGVDNTVMSTGTLIEARMVCFRRGGETLVSEVDELIEALGIQAIPPAEAEATVAQRAFVEFGKGSGHPAQLNFGDLFSYSLARSRNLPLLFKGDDFARTDIASALDA